MQRWILLAASFLSLAIFPTILRADDAEAIARGKKALETRSFSPAPWPFSAYDNVW